MSKRMAKSKKADPALGTTDRKRAIVAGALVVAVAGTLLVAAVLQTRPGADADTEFQAEIELPEPTHIEVGETDMESLPVDERLPAEPAQAVPATPPPSSGALTLRAEADLRRLAGPGGDWTLQFASMCDQGHVRSLVASLDGQDRLYLVPAGECYKIWWGRFGSREQAVSARGIPAALSRVEDSPFPRRIAESLP